MTRGDRFREAKKTWLRQEPDRTVKGLCTRVGVSEPAYYAWENNKTKDIKADNVMKFSQLTGFHPSWLLWGKGPKLLVDDERMREFVDMVSALEQDDYLALIKHADLLRQARQAKK